jgi:AcrR family transcriptional regulator
VRPGVYARGSETVDAILKAAAHVLIEEGGRAFSLRRIATECGLEVGNVSYHFPRKEMLVQVLLQEVLVSSESLVESKLRHSGISAEDALAMVITTTLDDIGTKRTTHLFTELWAMANQNDFVADRVSDADRYAQSLIGFYVAQLNPALGPDDVETVALYINSSIEGTTVLAGYKKPWAANMPQIKALAVKSLIHLAKTITPAEIHLLRPEKDGARSAKRPISSRRRKSSAAQG